MTSPVEVRPESRSPLRLLWQWLAHRSLALIALRLYSQMVRRVTGAPVWRYSQVAPKLYVCGQHNARGLAALKAHGITAIVNLRREFDDRAAGIAPEHYLYLPIEDNTAPTPEHLAQGVAFIAEEIARGGAVFIHCGVGVGRAPTMAAAYLVSTGLSPQQAWEVIRRARPFVWPNRRQLASVRQFAESRYA